MKFLPLASGATLTIVNPSDYSEGKKFAWGFVKYDGTQFVVTTNLGRAAYPWYIHATGQLSIRASDFRK